MHAENKLQKGSFLSVSDVLFQIALTQTLKSSNQEHLQKTSIIIIVVIMKCSAKYL